MKIHKKKKSAQTVQEIVFILSLPMRKGPNYVFVLFLVFFLCLLTIPSLNLGDLNFGADCFHFGNLSYDERIIEKSILFTKILCITFSIKLTCSSG